MFTAINVVFYKKKEEWSSGLRLHVHSPPSVDKSCLMLIYITKIAFFFKKRPHASATTYVSLLMEYEVAWETAL